MSKSGEDVKPGPIFTGEYSFGWRFLKYQMNARIVGYASQKLSPDSDSGIRTVIRGELDRGFWGSGEWKHTDIKHGARVRRALRTTVRSPTAHVGQGSCL
jgi:hypothetical protein